MSLCWFLYTYPWRIVRLRPSDAQYHFWKWRGSCIWCGKTKPGIKALFWANILHSSIGYQSCQMVWCGSCYHKVTSDIFEVNETMDEDGNLIYDCESDASRYKVGMYGAHLMGPFQCDLCVFCTLYHNKRGQVWADEEYLTIIWRMNMHNIWYVARWHWTYGHIKIVLNFAQKVDNVILVWSQLLV